MYVTSPNALNFGWRTVTLEDATTTPGKSQVSKYRYQMQTIELPAPEGQRIVNESDLESLIVQILTQPSSPRQRRCRLEIFTLFQQLTGCTIQEPKDLEVHRQEFHIDLTLKHQRLPAMVAVELKWGSKEGDGQTPQYRELLEQYYPNIRRGYVFASPKGSAAQDQNWLALQLQVILDDEARLVTDAERKSINKRHLISNSKQARRAKSLPLALGPRFPTDLCNAVSEAAREPFEIMLLQNARRSTERTHGYWNKSYLWLSSRQYAADQRFVFPQAADGWKNVPFVMLHVDVEWGRVFVSLKSMIDGEVARKEAIWQSISTHKAGLVHRRASARSSMHFFFHHMVPLTDGDMRAILTAPNLEDGVREQDAKRKIIERCAAFIQELWPTYRSAIDVHVLAGKAENPRG